MDEHLRRLERLARQGDPAARAALDAARRRASGVGTVQWRLLFSQDISGLWYLMSARKRGGYSFFGQDIPLHVREWAGVIGREADLFVVSPSTGRVLSGEPGTVVPDDCKIKRTQTPGGQRRALVVVRLLNQILEGWLRAFVRGYLEAALFTAPESAIDVDFDGHIIESVMHASLDDFSPKAIRRAEADCRSFLESNEALIEELLQVAPDMGRHGHDFYLTRTRSGVGFWDRDYGPLGEQMTQAAHRYPEISVEMVDGVVDFVG